MSFTNNGKFTPHPGDSKIFEYFFKKNIALSLNFCRRQKSPKKRSPGHFPAGHSIINPSLTTFAANANLTCL